jgi:hypothetical protein
MKTNIDIAIESWTKDAGDWTFAIDKNDEDTEFVDFHELTDVRRAEVVSDYGVTEDFLYDLTAHIGTIQDAIHQDLADIWKRLDAMEK